MRRPSTQHTSCTPLLEEGRTSNSVNGVVFCSGSWKGLWVSLGSSGGVVACDRSAETCNVFEQSRNHSLHDSFAGQWVHEFALPHPGHRLDLATMYVNVVAQRCAA
jgi:hypothetical protein